MADDRRVDIDIVAHDLASAVFKQVSASASSIFNSLTKVSKGIDRANYAFRQYNSSMANFHSTLAGLTRLSGRAVYNFTKDSITEFANLERQHAQTMGAMQSNYNKTAESQRKFLDDSKKLQEQAISLSKFGPTGKGSLYDSTQIASVQTELVKSGITADDILKTGVINDVIKFAGGNNLDLNEATDFAVNLGTQFGIKPADWGEMLDKVTKAADISPIEVTDIMESMKYAGGISSGLNRSLDEVLGMISVMGMAGLAGNMAGTGVQAMFSRILAQQDLSDKQIGNAPTRYVGQLYNAFRDDVIKNGDLVDMVKVTDDLNEAFEVLNDEEQAWFSKKMFGLYQMKAAYALAREGDDGQNLLEEAISQIENNSDGVLDYKYLAMLQTSYGNLESLKNAFTAVKQDFGSDLSPVTQEVSRQLHDWLVDPNNYQIDWSALESAVQESGDLIAQGYGRELGDAIANIGYFGIDMAQVIGAIGPSRSTSLITGLTQLLNGDFGEAWNTFKQGIADANDAIDGLPEDLQDTAKACNNVITFFEILAGMDVATKIAQTITSLTSLVQQLLIKPILESIKKSISNNVLQSAVTNIAQVNALNVANATVVNINGGLINGLGTGLGSAAGGAAGAAGSAVGGYLFGKIASGPTIYGGGYGMSPVNPELPGNTIGTPLLEGETATSRWAFLNGLGATAGGLVIGKQITEMAKDIFGFNTSSTAENYNMYVNGSSSDYNDYGTFSWKYAYERLKYGYNLSDEANNKISPYGNIVSDLVQWAYDNGALDVNPILNTHKANDTTSVSLMTSYIQGIADNWLQRELAAGRTVTDEQYSEYIGKIIGIISDMTSTKKDKNSFESNIGEIAYYGNPSKYNTITQDILNRLTNYDKNTKKDGVSTIAPIAKNPLTTRVSKLSDGILSMTGTSTVDITKNNKNISAELKSAIENSNLSLKTKMYTEKSIMLRPNFNVRVTVDNNGNIKSMTTSPSAWARTFSDSYSMQSSRFGN